MTTKSNALISLRPNAQWVLRGDDLEWIDTEQTQPTDAEIIAEIKRLQALEPIRVAKRSRAAAYAAESDPLFFKYQRGSATEQQWLDAVAEIKTRYPYPEA